MLHIIPDNKFKTASLAFYFSIPLQDKCEITAYSLLSKVLQRGSLGYPKTSDLDKRLQELYGAVFDSGVAKRGEAQVVYFRFEFLSDRYAGNNPSVPTLRGSAGILNNNVSTKCGATSPSPERHDASILRDIIALAKDIIWTPRQFNKDYIEQEKANLEEFIAGQINDKRSYAARRLVEIMCEGENYAFSEDGYAEELPKLTPKVLEMTHGELLKKPFEVFAGGDIAEEDVRALLEQAIPEVSQVREPFLAVDCFLGGGANITATERQNITQSKLAMGFSTGITARDSEFAALTVYNGVFGGGATSLLFNNVRERLSLCYYVGTRLDRFKGLMILGAGIENDKFEVAKNEILTQEARMRSGDFSDGELEAAKLSIINSYKSMLDSQAAVEEFRLRQILSGESAGIDEVIEGIRAVSREDVTRVARRVKLETTYLLTNN